MKKEDIKVGEIYWRENDISNPIPVRVLGFFEEKKFGKFDIETKEEDGLSYIPGASSDELFATKKEALNYVKELALKRIKDYEFSIRWCKERIKQVDIELLDMDKI